MSCLCICLFDCLCICKCQIIEAFTQASSVSGCWRLQWVAGEGGGGGEGHWRDFSWGGEGGQEGDERSNMCEGREVSGERIGTGRCLTGKGRSDYGRIKDQNEISRTRMKRTNNICNDHIWWGKEGIQTGTYRPRLTQLPSTSGAICMWVKPSRIVKAWRLNNRDRHYAL